MGAWGTSVFADDTASEIRDTYRELIANGRSEGAALAELRKTYLEESPELRSSVEPVFWLALALTQWEVGRLDDETRTKATNVIDSGQDLERWRKLGASAADLRKRGTVLASLRKKLLSPQGPPKRLPRRRRRVSPYRVGDIIQFTLSTGRLVLFEVTTLSLEGSPVTAVLNWIGTTLPSNDELLALPHRKPRQRIMLPALPKRGMDQNRFVVVASKKVEVQDIVEPFTRYSWDYFEAGLAADYELR